jgi:hypothetical protein
MLKSDNYIFIERDVKHARLNVSEDGKVRVIVPFSFTQDDVAALLEKKERWIEKNLEFFAKKTKIKLQRNQILLFGNRYAYFYDSTISSKVIVDNEHKIIRSKRDLLNAGIQEKWYKSVAKKHFVERTDLLANRLNFKFNKLYIRSQHKKWGNCSKEKNISLNWRLVKAPLFVIDYLIVHELVHTEIMNHTTKFWTMLRSYYPDYKIAVKWLDKYGNSL